MSMMMVMIPTLQGLAYLQKKTKTKNKQPLTGQELLVYEIYAVICGRKMCDSSAVQTTGWRLLTGCSTAPSSGKIVTALFSLSLSLFFPQLSLLREGPGGLDQRRSHSTLRGTLHRTDKRGDHSLKLPSRRGPLQHPLRGNIGFLKLDFEGGTERKNVLSRKKEHPKDHGE